MKEFALKSLRLHGALGKALELSCANRLKKVDYDLLVSPFRDRNENDGAWRCEFWGKIIRSAILTNFYSRDPELATLIEKSVRDMIATQTADGCISSYPAKKQTFKWDIWGRKYVLLGLLRYYDFVLPDETVKRCCIRMLDHLMTQVGPGQKSIIECGEHDGLAASSILGAVVGVYRISGEKRFLEFARYIVQSGCSRKHDIFAAAAAGVVPSEIGNGKAYELTSCFQGLAELYEFDPRPEYRECCENYFAAIRDREIFVTGVGGGKDRWGEYWFDGTFKQTRPDDGGLGETCVTVTWLHYCDRIMRLSESISPAKEAERALYNGILGSMNSEGSAWIHVNPTPLTGGGAKIAALDQIERGFHSPFGGNDCCLAQGPEALALAPGFAVVPFESGAALNFFEPLTAEFSNGTRLEIRGNYPYEPDAKISICSVGTFVLRLRIPFFCRRATLNGAELEISPESYLELERTWSIGDELRLEFDFSLREVPAPDGSAFYAVMRGPLVLAADSRGKVPGAPVEVNYRGRTLVDYASAGNMFSPQNTLTVWFA